MFRPLVGHLQVLWETDPRAIYTFNALRDPKCLQIILQECKIYESVYIKIYVTVLDLKS